MRSLSRTLSVRFSITMFVALLVIALWAYVGAQRVLRRELDRGLAAAAHLEAAILTIGHPLPQPPTALARDQFIETVNRFVVGRDAGGAVVTSNTPLATGLPLDSASFARSLNGEQVWTTQRWQDEDIRSFYLPMTDAPAGPRVVQVAASLQPMRLASRDVLFLMLGTVLLGMIATVFGAGWLARSAVAPVAEIAGQAESIEAGQVGQRITAHAGVSEFHALLRVLNQMLERLDRGILAQRRIIADVGHDLRTPITAMQGEIEVMLRSPRSPERYQETLRSLLEEVNHLATISDTLMTLARIETGELAPQLAPIVVDDLVQQAVERVRPRAGDREIHLERAEDGGQAALLDPHLVALALDQLLDNAVRHTPEGTPVSVSGSASNSDVVIVVEDDGPGVPAETLPHLFERFYRADAARGRSAGAGLGLTVAAAIVKAHGGKIAAERGQHGGLRVIMTLPKEGVSLP